MAERIKAFVIAHHRVEDFRPYPINFVDKGNHYANVIHALKLAIKKEGQYNGWFDVYCELFGQQKNIERKLDQLLTDGLKDNNEWMFNGVEWNDDGYSSPNEPSYNSTNVGLVVWVNFNNDNYGFGIAHRSETSKSPDTLTAADTNKYEVKWVTFTM